MRLRFQSSADSAAAFLESRARRRRRERKQERENTSPRRSPQPEPISIEPQEPAGVRRPIWLSSRMWHELVAHCNEFGLTPNEYIKRCLTASKLSKGGV